MINLLDKYYNANSEEKIKKEICELIFNNMRHYASYKLNQEFASSTQGTFQGNVLIYKPLEGGNRESRRLNSAKTSFFIFGEITEKDFYDFYNKRIKDKIFTFMQLDEDGSIIVWANDNHDPVQIRYKIIIDSILKYETCDNHGNVINSEFIRKIFYSIKYIRFT